MRFLIPAAIALLTTSAELRAETRSLTIATGDYAPFTGRDIAGDGIVNQTVRQIAARAGFDVEFAYMPWKRTLEMTRRGEFDGTSYWYYDAGRESDFFHVGPVIEDEQVFFAIAGSDIADFQTLEELSGLRIGVVTGYTYSPEFWNLAESGVLTVSEAQTDEANLRKLLAGRIDVFPISEIVGRHIIATSFPAEERGEFVVVGDPLIASHGYLLVPRSRPGAAGIAEALQVAADSLQAENAKQ